jgi:hypothetical protein
MSDICNVHLKIQEISKSNAGGRPHIFVKELAKQLNAPADEIRPFLDILYSTAFIDYYRDCRDVIALTEAGIKGEIPPTGI